MVVWIHGENGGESVDEENSKIWCEKCEIERKAINRMDGQCEKSIELKRNACGARKDECASWK